MRYDRTITITRPAAKTGEGALGYGGRVRAQEQTVVSGIRCSVQAKRDGQRGAVGLPADNKSAQWHILIPRGVITDGVIQDRDIVTDDLGRRFSVTSDYNHPLGWNLSCERLEA